MLATHRLRLEPPPCSGFLAGLWFESSGRVEFSVGCPPFGKVQCSISRLCDADFMLLAFQSRCAIIYKSEILGPASENLSSLPGDARRLSVNLIGMASG